MDDGLGANDPYRTMNSGEEGIQPDFLKNKSGGSAEKTLGMAEKVAQAAIAAKTGKAPAGEAGAGEAAGAVGKNGGGKKAAEEGFKSGAEKSGLEKAEKEESSPSLYRGRKGQESQDDEPSLKMSNGTKMALKAALPIVMVMVMVVGLIALIVGLPIIMIGAIDYNLQKVLGFEETVGVLEEQGEHITAELAREGKMPRQYFDNLVANGIDVGQVTANGDFVRTDTYIANIENKNDLVAAASGFSYVGDTEGELAMLFDGKIIYADDFVAAVESNPVLYAAYSNAADIGSKYYYSDQVEQDYREMGISRGAFNDWKSTGNYEEDEENYFNILEKVLSVGSNLQVGWYSKDSDSEAAAEGSTQGIVGEAKEIVSTVANKTKEYITNGVSATKRAAQLLNTAVSSGEPFLASLVFMAIEEPLQRARVDGDGPVNVVMNALTNGKFVKYRDVATGAEKTSEDSILETDNFRAAVSDGEYSKSEALNFGRDRILKTTRQGDKETIQGTTTATNGKFNSTSVVRNGFLSSADESALSGAEDAIDLAGADKNYEMFQTVVGGNRAIEGGSFISNTINMREIGALPSGEEKISEYHQETEKILARRAEADRATKSPFDVTSPNTFFGSIVHNIAKVAINNYGSGSSALSAINSAGDTAGKAIASLSGIAVADGNGSFTAMSGEGCETVGTVGVEGDLYCTSHNTVSTKYMSNSKLDWDLIIDKDKFKDFVTMGMDRYATVGVKNAEICEKYRAENDSAWSKIGSFFTDMIGLYDACDEDHVPIEIATGAKYTFGSQGDNAQNELYSGFALYDKVRSLLTGEQSTVAAIREEYYKEHPLDNSRAGIIARISGMGKDEAELALLYADYLSEVANYDPASRYIFNAPTLTEETPILEYHSNSIALDLYAWYSKQTEYDDLRTRNFVV